MNDTPSENEERRSFREEASSLWLIALAPSVWAFHFAGVYGATAVVCEKAESVEAVDLLRIGIGMVTLIALVLIGLVARKAWRQWDYLDDYDHVHHRPTGEHRHEFLGHAAFLLSIMSMVAVVYTALPAVLIGTCL